MKQEERGMIKEGEYVNDGECFALKAHLGLNVEFFVEGILFCALRRVTQGDP